MLLRKRSYKRAIIHVDGDSFFVSCEMAVNPALKGKPVVTGQERGIASAVSYEAKALGVKRTMSIYKLKKEFPQVIVVSSDYQLYEIFSHRMVEIVRRHAPIVEAYSIDECFADITNMISDEKLLEENPNESLENLRAEKYEQIAKKIKDDLFIELGITFSVGLASTKALAKIASKKNKPNGLSFIPEEEIENNLANLPIEKVWGIGGSTFVYMNKLGIKTALDFINKDINWVTENLAKPYHEMWYEIKGTSLWPVSNLKEEKQLSLSRTRSFRPSKNKEYIFSQLSKNIEEACMSLRQIKMKTYRVEFMLKTQEFIFQKLEIDLPALTSSPLDFISKAREFVDKNFRRNTLYRTTGITLKKLTEKDLGQLDLFTPECANGVPKKDVYEFIDKISQKYGSEAIFLASSLNARPKNQFNHKRLNIPMLGIVK